MTDKPYGTLYIGVTGDLPNRDSQHKSKVTMGFTKRYNLTRLVYAESFQHINDAIACEKRMKKWNRKWKIDLIEKSNPTWENLNII